ncbi:3-hydroxybutyryl-CoA dehydrogenase [Microbacterium phyllosphaerae]|uniref:3-hydroxybutyryl-CoA dehydrogenase n=1 Tax=Microbacterium phyllosphaerae TaxID=124798 RepID=A0ABS4WUX9_9MICO|nr:3-hydroxyacyl-CoA dehydrogenase family protein [Microbacterium phyllosphaerae]MBP2379871.1 3-hydroxybutyryl-CoA dehydrogenase [Microbacterium phyllosphaerae]
MSGAPERVGVIGGGRMGAGIAQVFAQAGSMVTVVERDAASMESARDRLADGVTKAAARIETVDATETLSRLHVTAAYEDLSSADLVVEAVPEILDLKIGALTRAEQVLSPSAWITTNTSSLPVSQIAEHLSRPERFCGLHFFNPVPPSALVEVVLAPLTAAEMRSAAGEWITALAKTAIFVNDTPGFASSRLGNALALEAMRMVEEGVASAADIDTAMELGYRHATGPLRTSDLVGLDVRLDICEFLHATLGERFAPPQILRDKVAAGDLGRKTGRGFFDYPVS